MDKVTSRYHDMIRINSVNGHEINLANYIAEALRAMGLEPRYHFFEADIDHVRPSVYVEVNSGRPGKKLLLIGHIDTVKVADGWNTDPFEPTVIGDRTYGLGAMDMKGGLTAILETVEYYASHRDEFTGILAAAFVADEENLSEGTYQLVRDGLTADMAVMAECRFDNVAIGFRGRIALDVEVKGSAAHVSRYPFEGENAIINAAKLAAKIESLPTDIHPIMGGGTWCIRHIEGGDTGALVVPDRCMLFVDRYVVPGETFESCKKQIQAAAKEIGLDRHVEITLHPRKLPYLRGFAIPEDAEIVTGLREAFREVCGKDLPYACDKSAIDSNILVLECGIPTVTFGPSGSNMHSANEYGHIDQVKACCEIYKRYVKKMLA